MALLPPSKVGPRVIIGCTGSVATIKVPELARRLQDRGASVVIVPTEHACHFLKCQAKVDSRTLKHTSFSNDFTQDFRSVNNGETVEASGQKTVNSCERCSHCGSMKDEMGTGSNSVRSLYPDLTFVLEQDEWSAWQKRGDAVVHIQLRDWAQVMVIAPLDANTMAKMAQGLCDNLLTCIVRAWDVGRPLIFCPAMNTHMYIHPLTARHTAILKELGYLEVSVVSKRLACGEVGQGGMAELDTIVDAVMQELPGAHRVTHGPF